MLALFDNCNDVKILYRPVQHRMHCGCCPHVSAGVCAAGGSVLDALGGWHHLVSGSASLVIKEAEAFSPLIIISACMLMKVGAAAVPPDKFWNRYRQAMTHMERVSWLIADPA